MHVDAVWAKRRPCRPCPSPAWQDRLPKKKKKKNRFIYQVDLKEMQHTQFTGIVLLRSLPLSRLELLCASSFRASENTVHHAFSVVQ